MKRLVMMSASKRGALVICAVALCATQSSAAVQQEVLSPRDAQALRSIAEVATSPDGRLTAYALVVPRRAGEDDNGEAWRELHIVDADGSSRAFVTGEVKVENVAWMPDGSAITFLAKRDGDEEKSLYKIPIGGGESQKLIEHGDGISEYSWSPDGSTLVFLAKPQITEEREELEEKGFDQKIFEEDWRPVEVWITEFADEELNEPRRLELPGSASELSFSPAGDTIAVALAPTSLIDDHYMRRHVHIVALEDGNVEATIETSGKLGRVVWSPDGKRLALIAGIDENDPVAAHLMVVSVGGGSPEMVNAGIEADAIDLAWIDRDTILWVRAQGVERAIVKQSLGGPAEIVVGPGGPIWSRLSIAGGVVSAIGQTPSHPDEAFRWALGGSDAVRMTDSNPWLAERRLAAQKVVEFEARDGLLLQGLLLRPIDLPADTRAPLVLVVHGGPEAHFANGWLTNYSRPGQVLAGKGYAVFYPNYRGSTGRGHEFATMSQGDPAGREFEDLIDAVDHLIELGVVDEDRVGITGGSYGGYATAWGSTFFSERFAAGVMFVGISEKVAKLGTSDIPHELYQVHARIWPWENWQKMLERSPVFHVEKARTPLLILGGDADPRVHPSQSLALYRYLKILGKAPVRYVIYPGEEHGNRKAAARYDYTLRLLRWFDHYLKGPGGEPPPPELDYGLSPEIGEEEEKDRAAEGDGSG